MKPSLPLPAEYGDWLTSLKSRIQRARQRALLSANAEQIRLYHDIGLDILEHQSRQGWGAIRHITRFLLELGAGFAFVGRQFQLVVGGDEFFIDLEGGEPL